LSPIAQEKFSELAPELVRIGVLTTADVDTFACYCEAFAEVQDCLALIAERGDYYFTDKGTVLVHPAVYRKNKAIERMYKFGSVLGLNPSSRSSIEVSKPATSKLSKFL
jgi:P27 family predicted phage terminase small subunit